MTKHTSKLYQRIEKGREAAIERRRTKSRDAGIAALEKQRDGTKHKAMREFLTRRLDERRGYLERQTKRMKARTDKRAARRAKRRGAAAPASRDIDTLNARDAIAEIATLASVNLVDAARALEEARDKPRTTVIEALDARAAELNG